MFLYGLHAGDGEIRYVGITTCKDPRKRLWGHRSEARRGRSKAPVYHWMRKHGVEHIEMLLLGTFADRDALNSAERAMISSLPNLLNVLPGGSGQADHRARSPRANLDHCRQGHCYEEVGSYLVSGKYRGCKACHKSYARKYNQKRQKEDPDAVRAAGRERERRRRRRKGIEPRNINKK